MHYNCLIIDDEIELSKMTQEYFEMFEVSCAIVSSADSAEMSAVPPFDAPPNGQMEKTSARSAHAFRCRRACPARRNRRPRRCRSGTSPESRPRRCGRPCPRRKSSGPSCADRRCAARGAGKGSRTGPLRCRIRGPSAGSRRETALPHAARPYRPVLQGTGKTAGRAIRF